MISTHLQSMLGKWEQSREKIFTGTYYFWNKWFITKLLLTLVPLNFVAKPFRFRYIFLKSSEH